MRKNSLLSGLIISALLWTSTSQGSWADVQLRSFHSPFGVVMQESHSSKTSSAGEPFLASTPETYCVRQYCVPENTIFKGEISRAAPSRRYWRPGYLTFQVEDVFFPSGGTVHFDNSISRLTGNKVHYKGSTTLWHEIIRGIPTTASGTVLPIILDTTTTLSHGAILAISMPTTAVVGAVTEVLYPTIPDSNIPSRIALGLLSPFAIPFLVGFIHLSPNVDIAAGDTVQLSFPDPVAHSIFIQSL